nr:hypothetical protein GCM10020092_079940 [Actinoplanes digitatis]
MLRLAPSEDPDPPREGTRVVSRRLEGLPGAFQEDTVLGIHELGLARTQTEEGSVEGVCALQDALGTDIARLGEKCGADASFVKFLLCEGGDALLTGGKVGPECLDVGRLREASCHADDGHL